MLPIFSLFQENPYLIIPTDLIGWFGVAVFIYTIIHSVIRFWGLREKQPRYLGLILVLLIATPLASIYFGARLPDWGALAFPGLAIEPQGRALMYFSAIPWVLAAMLYGPLSGALVALASGLVLAIFDTHNIITPLQIALIAVLFAGALRQKYRTPFFKLLRHPIFAGIVMIPLIALLSIAGDFLITGTATIASRLDYAITNVFSATVSIGGSLIIATLVGEFVRLAFIEEQDDFRTLIPSPAEKSLGVRYLFIFMPLMAMILAGLVVGDWIMAGRTARVILQDRMEDAASNAASAVPLYFSVGQSLINRIAEDDRIIDSNSTDTSQILAENMRTLPFFRQLILLDNVGNRVASYPSQDLVSIELFPVEEASIVAALDGIGYQDNVIPTLDERSAVWTTFLRTIPDIDGKVEFVLIGRADMFSSPVAEPIDHYLSSLTDVGGVGYIVNQTGMILFQSNDGPVFRQSPFIQSSTEIFTEGTSPDGTRSLFYIKPAPGRNWTIVLSVPASYAQQLALDMAAPMLQLIFFVSVAILVILRVGMSSLTKRLQKLANEANLIAGGELDHPLEIKHDDEIGAVRRSVEKMRGNLKARLDELNRLLKVSQGVASKLNMEEAVQPILEAALVLGASSARVVLMPDAVPELSDGGMIPTQFGLGSSSERFRYLDGDILKMNVQKPVLLLTNPSRVPLLNIRSEAQKPEGIIAVALNHEESYYGTLWLAFERPHIFVDEEVRYLVTLAGHAALAAANSRLYLTAEIGRQRLMAILSSTPAPVLVTDHRDHLLLANPAAWQVFNLDANTCIGKHIYELFPQSEILDILTSSDETQDLVELKLARDQIYHASASAIIANGRNIGRVCVLRDITRYKELDSLKTDFVESVSHDLRAPLTLIRGYATMLDMVGGLNEPQTMYVNKMLTGVDNMSNMVNNLLDLGRIEAGIGMQPEHISVKGMIESAVTTLRMKADQKRIKLHTVLKSDVPQFMQADQALLQQALRNLVDNAVKFTAGGGEVWIRASRLDNNVLFEVEDSGSGVAPVDQPRLFEKFYKGGGTVDKVESGTGLGLAIVKSIVESHKGRVWVDSQLGKGSKFYMSIPIEQDVPIS